MNDRIEQIEARAEAATEGPWAVETSQLRFGKAVYVEDGFTWGRAYICGDIKQGMEDGKQDAEFIANAREDVPYLLALVREQQAQIERVEALADEMSARPNGEVASAKGIAGLIRAALTKTQPETDS